MDITISLNDLTLQQDLTDFCLSTGFDGDFTDQKAKAIFLQNYLANQYAQQIQNTRQARGVEQAQIAAKVDPITVVTTPPVVIQVKP